MIELRPFSSTGAAHHGWLDAHHHFSFASYHDPSRMGWGKLRVWNDDIIAPNSGFPPHPHANMEIVTYVREGAITHEDSQGNRGRTTAGDVQVMSAGTGIVHSEYNLEDHSTSLFQIWIRPNRTGAQPAWGTRPFPRQDRSGQFVVLASGFADDTQALPINADARVLGAMLKKGERTEFNLGATHYGYLVVASGAVEISDGTAQVQAHARDGTAIHGAETLTITAHADSEIVLVDAA